MKNMRIKSLSVSLGLAALMLASSCVKDDVGKTTDTEAR